MTLDEMIYKLGYNLDTRMSSSHDVYKSVVAALRAGQQMREAARSRVMNMGGKYQHIAESNQYGKGVEAWDAATKGESP